jgi:hypothetical protein
MPLATDQTADLVTDSYPATQRWHMLTARRPPVGKADALSTLDGLAVEQPPALPPAPCLASDSPTSRLARHFAMRAALPN